MECGKKFNGWTAYSHMLETGHTRWKLLLPRKQREVIMPQVKMCKNCKRLVTLETELCPGCGYSEFISVELSPQWLEEHDLPPLIGASQEVIDRWNKEHKGR